MRRWIAAAFIAVTLVLLIAHDVPLVRYLERTTTERLVAEMERDAFILAGTSEDQLSNPDDPVPIDLAATALAYAAGHDAHVVITNADGIAVATTELDRPAGTDYGNRPEIASVLAGSPTSGRRWSETLATELVYVAVPVLSGADVVGAVRISYSSVELDRRVTERSRLVWAVAGISLAAAVIAALGLAASISRPLRRLTTAVGRIAAGDLTARAAINSGPPELREVGRAFNHMTEQVESLVRQQRQFAGDASHQLRTPLTALGLQLGRARHTALTNPFEAASHIESAQAEASRLQSLVNGLLALARSEHGTADPRAAEMTELVADRVRQWEPLVTEHGVTLNLHSSTNATALVTAGNAEQVIDNLLDNAVRHTPSGGSIDVSVLLSTEFVEVIVSDGGPGLTPEQTERAFDRFWRGADAPEGGSGLGLPIARQLARNDGGDLRLAAAAAGGLVASYRLRRAPFQGEASRRS